ncbi:hypothetical protein NC653_024053 [Populus alba x Populus x berolinensis]|uniref:Uncharacterized protein n=1 Tax=Populus alba x Populus x berolinensis TaxID=444605 RepID=A0AAD6QBI1_9ROSI|nr:hypothetical protein NC653_024053 [Populus alba x Populus x berolinensis]
MKLLSYLDGLKLPSVVVSFKETWIDFGTYNYFLAVTLHSSLKSIAKKTKILYEKKKQLKLMLLWVTAQQWRWKIFEQCQRYWILATAFTEESCLLRARQPSSMLDLAKGNEKVKSGRCLARYKISSYIMTLMHGMIMIAQS